jgi:curved DNA-binding protein CbpA
MDHYKILGVAREASDEEIRFAYRRRSSECHPDKGGNTEEMAAINEARDVLLDPERRAAYDEGRAAPVRENVGLEAKNLLFQMFDAVLEHAPEENPIKAVEFFLEQHIGEFQDTLTKLERRIAKFRAVAAKVKVKKKGTDNLFLFFTERKIDGLQPELDNYKFVIEVSKLARQLIDTLYVDEPAGPKPSRRTNVVMSAEYRDFFGLKE